eukprot:8883043-Alexandrium_andersonii.AAC.1
MLVYDGYSGAMLLSVVPHKGYDNFIDSLGFVGQLQLQAGNEPAVQRLARAARAIKLKARSNVE